MCNVRRLAYGIYWLIFVGLIFPAAPRLAFSEGSPCAPKAKKPKTGAASPCAPASQPCALKGQPCAPSRQPCAPKGPCAPSGQPCAPGARPAGPSAKAVMVIGQVAKVDPGARKLVVSADGRQIDVALGKYAIVREGPKVKSLREVRPGARVTVSYVDSGRERTAWFVYLASAARVASPCAPAGPCAVRSPCAPAGPCAPRSPCAPQPCAPKAKKPTQPCAPQPCAVQPCAPKGKKAR